jgi:hypothetical protein
MMVCPTITFGCLQVQNAIPSSRPAISESGEWVSSMRESKGQLSISYASAGQKQLCRADINTKLAEALRDLKLEDVGIHITSWKIIYLLNYVQAVAPL